jgi:hypothetical protein
MILTTANMVRFSPDRRNRTAAVVNTAFNKTVIRRLWS